MSQQAWQGLHIGIGVLTAGAAALLGMMFWNSSLTNRDRFTISFLRLLSMMTVAKAIEIASAMYRTAQIQADAIPVQAAVVGLIGRAVELGLYLAMIWFLLRPETRKALNGGSTSKQETL